VTVGEAMRVGIGTKDELEDFVSALQNDEASIEDEETEGRSKSLGASLSYGFGVGFSEDERKILALLHLFQGFINIDALRMMGHPDADWGLQSVRGLTREQAIGLLDRAADLGLKLAAGATMISIRRCPGIFEICFSAITQRRKATAPAAPSLKPWVGSGIASRTSILTEIARYCRP
jgi:hypothetical protein